MATLWFVEACQAQPQPEWFQQPVQGDLGVKEFAGKVRMASPNVLRAIHPRHNPTPIARITLPSAI
ncbi:MAG: hypothetical protein ABI868_21155 [Acidobacteriota bacterium]